MEQENIHRFSEPAEESAPVDINDRMFELMDEFPGSGEFTVANGEIHFVTKKGRCFAIDARGNFFSVTGHGSRGDWDNPAARSQVDRDYFERLVAAAH